MKKQKQLYLNSAKYLKLGSTLWVDRAFAESAINATYSFHASTTAYAEYWNNNYGDSSMTMSREHVWQAFVQDYLRTIASESNIDLELDDHLSIKDVTIQAFGILGERGIIRAADNHACEECTQELKKSSDVIFENPVAAENVPEESQHAASPMSTNSFDNTESMDVPNKWDALKKWVTMRVLDGLVMGPQVI
jgi:hypothetical protein